VSPDPRERLLDLLAAEATQGLSPAEARELAELLAHHPGEDADSLARAAAAADLALAGDPAPLPPALAAKLERRAAEFLAAPPPAEPAGPVVVTRTPPHAFLGWAIAAGLAAVFLWTQLPDRTPAEKLARLERRDGTRAFVGEKESAAGRVVWNRERQEGYVEVRGLPPVNPATETYQLWIVDPSQKHPIDGGVFTVNADGTTVVPISAKLKVKDAAAFAVTREAAGGVVVSGGPHLLVLTPKAE
jgi:anti-sigma-K factor RskA